MNILAVPQGSKKLIKVKLPTVGSDDGFQDYLYDEDEIALYEVRKYSDKFRSWFLDNSFCKEGHINIITKVDPLYIFLPIVKKLAKDRFMQLQDICMTYNSDEANSGLNKLDHALSPSINWNNICETKEIDNDLYIKFCEKNTLGWLLKKHKATMEALRGSLDAQASTATLISYANDLIAHYLPGDLIPNFRENIKRNTVITDYSSVNVKANQTKKPICAPDPKVGPNKVPKKAHNSETKDLPKDSVMRFFTKEKK